MLALVAADDLRAPEVADFNLILARQLQSELHRFRPAGGEIHGPTFVPSTCKVKQFGGILLGNWRRELAGMDELDRARLIRHRGDDLGDTVADEIDGP